jgi:hypothetical protein
MIAAAAAAACATTAVQMMEMTNDLNNKEDEARLLRQNLSTALEDMALLKVTIILLLQTNITSYTLCWCTHCYYYIWHYVRFRTQHYIALRCAVYT